MGKNPESPQCGILFQMGKIPQNYFKLMGKNPESPRYIGGAFDPLF
jgi:hypothetical protein